MGDRSRNDMRHGVSRPDAPVRPAGAGAPGARLAEAASEGEGQRPELAAELRSAGAGASASSLVLAEASHELRTPLNGIIGLAEILRHKAAPGPVEPAEVRRLAGEIHESGVYLLNVVEALLDLSRLEITRCAKLRPTAICAELDAALRALGPLAERRRIAVENACDPAVEWAVDRRVFRQVAINLVSNAVKFSPSGSTVRIAATRDAEMLALHVGDQGPGVSEADRERILMPFDRGPNAERYGIDGVGLGLTIVAELLKRQGGKLVIESAEGGGSIFTAVFPAPHRP